MRRVLVLAPSFYPAVRSGGPAISITNLARDASKDYRVDVVAPDRDLGGAEPFQGLSGRRVSLGAGSIYYLDLSSPRQISSLLSRLRKNHYDLVVLNSVWNAKLSIIPSLLIRVGVLDADNVVLFPRGELEVGAIALKRHKKRFFGSLVRRAHEHVVTHVATTSSSETSRATAWFPEARVVRSTNQPDPVPFSHQRANGPLRVVALGRVHPTKGLLELVRALEGAPLSMQLTIAGPIEDQGYWRDCLRSLSSLQGSIVWDYVGLVSRAQATKLVQDSDLLVSLTLGENFGHTIAESLQAGCSVVTTHTTPWTRILQDGAGTIVDDRTDRRAVASALQEWAGKDPEQLLLARERARAGYEQWRESAPPNAITQVLGQNR